ncbi:MAG: hypothetical protein OXB95_12975 [Rhodobacteraceae bacterium]|nr:hypothetical protein [Paracoccaceae bacterium]
MKSRSMCNLNYLKWRPVKHYLAGRAKLGAPIWPNRVFRVATCNEKCCAVRAHHTCEVGQQSREIINQVHDLMACHQVYTR